MDILLDSLYLVAVIASLVFFFGVVLASAFIGSKFYKFISFILFVIAFLSIFSWLFESIIPDDLSTWISVASFIWFSSYLAGIFLFFKLVKKRLGKILFRIREYNRFLVISSSFLLALGLLIFFSRVNSFDSASMVERMDLAAGLVFFVCVAFFSTSTLVNELEIRENGVVFLDFLNLSNMAFAKRRNIDSLVLDSPRNILRMNYRTIKGENKEVGKAVKASHVDRIVAVLNNFYPN